MQQLNLETIAESDRGKKRRLNIHEVRLCTQCQQLLQPRLLRREKREGERKKNKNCCRVTFKYQLWRNKTRGGGSLRSDSTTLSKLKKTWVIVGGKKKKKVDSLLLNMKWCHRWLQNKSTHPATRPRPANRCSLILPIPADAQWPCYCNPGASCLSECTSHEED